MFRLNMWTRPFLPPPGGLTLDNNSYLQNHLAPPALMVLSPDARADVAAAAAAEKTDSAAAISGSLNPFQARPGDPFPHLYSPLHSPFLRPGLGLFSHAVGGAFRPVTSPTEHEREAFNSAFLPAAKKARLDEEKPTDLSRNGNHGLSSPGEQRSPHDTSSDLHSESGSNMERTTPEAANKPLPGQPSACPICFEVLSSAELQSHISQELEKICVLRNQVGRIPGSMLLSAETNDPQNTSPESNSNHRFETFQRIKHNRLARLGAKKKKRRTQEENVIIRNNGGEDAGLVGRLGGQKNGFDESFEEPQKKQALAADEEDINVDVDETNMYGGAQYSEADVVKYYRDSATVGDDSRKDNAVETEPKCYVCKGCSFRNPVISVSCWHIYCEGCWLQTLAEKKLCPQCNVITSPSDLRKVHF